ncbi:MAG: hypothetical protein HQL87_08575 [Magnetococcales bacterium]|nr:hypothetical protein [Magnetococcales bacterium]
MELLFPRVVATRKQLKEVNVNKTFFVLALFLLSTSSVMADGKTTDGKVPVPAGVQITDKVDARAKCPKICSNANAGIYDGVWEPKACECFIPGGGKPNTPPAKH